MPSTCQGTVTTPYKSGLKVDGAWHPYADPCPRMDLRSGDRVRLEIDDQGRVTALEITERGQGALPAETISDGQRELLSKLVDDRELTVEALEEQFLVPFKGKRLAELSKVEAGLFISFFFGRANRPRRSGGRR